MSRFSSGRLGNHSNFQNVAMKRRASAHSPQAWHSAAREDLAICGSFQLRQSRKLYAPGDPSITLWCVIVTRYPPWPEIFPTRKTRHAQNLVAGFKSGNRGARNLTCKLRHCTLQIWGSLSTWPLKSSNQSPQHGHLFWCQWWVWCLFAIFTSLIVIGFIYSGAV